MCFSCYKSHLLILQGKKVSNDSDLQSTQAEVRHRIGNTAKPSTFQQVCDLATDKTVVYVGEELLQRNALLLPVVYDYFSECLNKALAEVNLQGTERKTSLTSLWVLSNLISTLQHHLVYSCKARKYGTLLYRPRTDLTPILQQSLWKLRQHELKGNKIQPPQPNQPTSNTLVMDQVLDDLNVKIQGQCQNYLAKNDTFINEHSTFGIDKEIEHMNPDLWKAICMLTRSVSERRGTSTSQTNSISTEKHRKRIRRFFLLCSLMFCTDDRCSMPMHILNTDVIDSQGGVCTPNQDIKQAWGMCITGYTFKVHPEQSKHK